MHLRHLACLFVLFFLSFSAHSTSFALPGMCEDKGSYHFFQMENGIKVITISDPKALKSKVALDVGVGSRNDPKDIPGLAHFVEHMLFLGTEKYPEADAYRDFLAAHGGDSNAYTYYDSTTYFFEIEPDSLLEGVARFSDQFVSPTMTPDYIGKERQAIEAEFQYRKTHVYRMMEDTIKDTLGYKHPASRFDIGNKLAFEDFSDTALATRARSWWRAHYHPKNMSLVVSGPQTNSELETLVRSSFKNLKGFDTYQEPALKPLDISDTFPGLIKTRLDDTERYMILAFPVPVIANRFSAAPEAYLEYLFEQSSELTLASNLRGHDLAKKVSVHFESYDDYAWMVFSIDLVYQGGEKYWDVIKRVMRYVELVNAQIGEEWRFEEFKKAKALEWCHSVEDRPVKIALNLGRTNESFAIANGYTATEFDAGLYRSILDNIRLDNMLAVIAHPNHSSFKSSQWLGVEYDYKKLSPSDLRHFSPDKKYYLALPEKNPYLPDNIEKVVRQQGSVVPMDLAVGSRFNAWYSAGIPDNNPRAYFKVLLRSDTFDNSERNAASGWLFWSLLKDKLAHDIRSAADIDTHLSIQRDKNGLGLYFDGYSQSISTLLEKTLETIKTFKSRERDYEGYRYGWRQYLLEPEDIDPVTRTDNLKSDLLHGPSFDDRDLANGMRDASYSRFIGALETWRKGIQVTSLAYGNVSEETAKRWNTLIRDKFEPETSTVNTEEDIAQLPKGIHRIFIDDENHEDAILRFYVQGHSNAPSEQFRFRLLEKMIADRFFSDLRTEKQLGYAVHASFDHYLGYPGLEFFIQSPQHSPDNLEAEVLSFFDSFSTRLQAMSLEEFAQFKTVLIKELITMPTSNDDLASRYWASIRNNLSFSYKESMATADEALTRDEMQAWFKERFAAENRKALSLLAKGSTKDVDERWEDDIDASLIESITGFRQQLPRWKVSSTILSTEQPLLTPTTNEQTLN